MIWQLSEQWLISPIQHFSSKRVLLRQLSNPYLVFHQNSLFSITHLKNSLITVEKNEVYEMPCEVRFNHFKNFAALFQRSPRKLFVDLNLKVADRVAYKLGHANHIWSLMDKPVRRRYCLSKQQTEPLTAGYCANAENIIRGWALNFQMVRLGNDMVLSR